MRFGIPVLATLIACVIASAAVGLGGYGYAATAARATVETVRGRDVMSTPVNDQLRQGRDCAAPPAQLRRSDMCRKLR